YLFLAGTVCTAGLYLLQLQILKGISAFTMMLTYNLEPVYSIILAMIIFNEARELNFSFYVGLCCIIASISLKTWKLARARRLDPALNKS
ncbi:MAG: EamA family transporter, partial [Succinivibrio sp.]